MCRILLHGDSDDLLAGGSADCHQSYGGRRHHHLPRALRGHVEGDPRVRKRGDTRT